MPNLELLDLDRNHDDKNDEGTTPAPTSCYSRKKAKTGAQGGRDLKGLASARALCPLPEYVPLISE
ncbi:hypothetical protein BDR03DRAFT_1018979 [Suillus americanus]|nr:hypothetical protein BDR03DRAFT_1018979 [Suillus americanus]